MYYNILTEKEKQILELIAINGLNQVEIGQKLYLSPNTVYTHLNSICYKLGFSGKSRVYQLIVFYWMNIIKGVEKMRNCTECKSYTSEEKCKCPQSEYLDEFVNEYMICREFEVKKNDKKTVKTT